MAVARRPADAYSYALPAQRLQTPFDFNFTNVLSPTNAFALPQLDLSASYSVPAQPEMACTPSFDALQGINFDPDAIAQLLEDSSSYFPDIDVALPLSLVGGEGQFHNSSSGSSPRDDQSHTSADQEDSSFKSSSSALHITEEEREMLAESGVIIPDGALTLTKAEDKALKAVRRRLRNKLSAQDSRRKKKEYVDGLEQRVASCTSINIEMQSRVQTLATENRTLRQQLQQLKELVARLAGPQPAATTGTLLMVLALSFSMFINPLASSVATSSNSDATLVGSRTLKALPYVVPSTMTNLRDILSSWLGLSCDENEAPPLLRRQPMPITAGALHQET